jgi:hypothetical protein
MIPPSIKIKIAIKNPKKYRLLSTFCISYPINAQRRDISCIPIRINGNKR